jgi:hypothetical protein
MSDHLERARAEIADMIPDAPTLAELRRDEQPGGYEPNRHPNGLLILKGEAPGQPWSVEQRRRALRRNSAR